MASVEESVSRLFLNIDLNHPLMDSVYHSIVEYRYENDVLPHVETITQTGKSLPLALGINDIKRKIQRSEIKLPEVPTIVVKLNEMMDDPHASASDVAQIVSTSPSLSAVLLRIVNSAAFGLPTKIDSIVRAVSLLGTRQISSLAMGISVMLAFGNIPSNLINMNQFIIHSLSCATIARIIAALANIRNTEQLFISGLLHDIGRLILFKYFPDIAKTLLHTQEIEKSDLPLFDIEKKLIGATHSQIANLLLKQWNFPSQLNHNIVYHHTPSRAQNPAEASIVQLADMIAHGIGFGQSGERIIPDFDENAWENVGISANSAKMAIRQATHQLKTIKTIIF